MPSSTSRTSSGVCGSIGQRQSTAGVRRRSRRLSRSPQRRRLRQRHRCPRLPAGVLPGGARRLVLPPARARVRARDLGVAPGCADRDAGAVADAPPAIGASAGRAAGGLAQGPLPADPAEPGRRASPGAHHRRDVVDRHGGRVSVPRRGVPAALQGIRLPDALGGEAGHFARSDAADHGQGQQRAPGDSRRAQLRRAHRPRRGRRRSRRHQFHGALDQPRSVGRLPEHGREDPVCRRRLSRSPAGSAHLSAGADQGGADRRERHDRGADLRAGARRAAAEGGGSREGDRRRAREPPM